MTLVVVIVQGPETRLVRETGQGLQRYIALLLWLLLRRILISLRGTWQACRRRSARHVATSIVPGVVASAAREIVGVVRGRLVPRCRLNGSGTRNGEMQIREA